MITLTTGLPGAGKTLYTLNYVKALAERDNRQVFYSGIPELALPWTECDPQKWFELPAGSIVVIDECQRVFRPRIHGSTVPEFVAKLETHRHLGIDLFFITQHPMLVDANVRKLVGQHFHSVRAFGISGSNVHEWGQCKENCDKSRSDSAAVHKFKYPKASYAWYKSAEVHTHKARIPMKLWILIFIVLALPVLVWSIYGRLSDKASGVTHGDQSVTSAQVAQMGVVSGPVGAQALSPSEYTARFQPRVQGLEYTAPVYDDVTKPVRAPYPAACLQSKTRCSCYTQQGTRLAVPVDLCKQIAEGGFFMAWDEGNKGQGGQGAQEAKPVQAVPRLDRGSEPLPGYLNLTPGATPPPARTAAQDQQDGASVAQARVMRQGRSFKSHLVLLAAFDQKRRARGCRRRPRRALH